jgi:hypothetical protein
MTRQAQHRPTPLGRRIRKNQAPRLSDLHIELLALVGKVRREAAIESLTIGQLSRSTTVRRRRRAPGSTRHLAEIITSRHGPAGIVSHVRIAAALAGDPALLLDEVLVLALVEACHDVRGRRLSDKSRSHWKTLIDQAAECSVDRRTATQEQAR